MAGLADHLGPLLMTGRGPLKRPPTARQVIRRAHTRAGTWRATAQLLGVSESTLRLWRHGGNVSPRKLESLREWDTMSRLRKAPDPDKLLLRFEFDGRHREVDAAGLRLAPGTLQAAQDAWVTGGPSAAVAAFLQGVNDPNHWYRNHLAAWDVRERALARIPDTGDLTDEEVEDLEDIALAELDENLGAGYGDITPEEVAGEEIQGELEEYFMAVYGLR